MKICCRHGNEIVLNVKGHQAWTEGDEREGPSSRGALKHVVLEEDLVR